MPAADAAARILHTKLGVVHSGAAVVVRNHSCLFAPPPPCIGTQQTDTHASMVRTSSTESCATATRPASCGGAAEATPAAASLDISPRVCRRQQASYRQDTYLGVRTGATINIVHAIVRRLGASVVVARDGAHVHPVAPGSKASNCHSPLTWSIFTIRSSRTPRILGNKQQV
jgi:hypothetical protein